VAWNTPASVQRNVVTVRVSLLARSTEITPGWQTNATANRTYTLGLTTATPTPDGYKRSAFSSVARVINVSSLREKQCPTVPGSLPTATLVCPQT
jgi:hypothetical protein